MADLPPYMGRISPSKSTALPPLAFSSTMADSPLFSLQLQPSGNSDDDDISPISTEADSDEPLPIVKENRCDALRLQCIAGHLELKKDSTLNFYIAPIHEPPQLVIQIGGTDVWYIDTPPDSEVHLLQTVELDFVVQVLGETELIFVTGERRRVRPGDLTIQRSSVYRWRNSSKMQLSRMMGFMSSSRSILKENESHGAESAED
jgi:hypothetical protein